MSLYKDASLVMIPSAYKDGKLYSVRPTDGSGDFTFSRGSNLAATRVDVNGLIEKGRENLLLQSNNLTTTWGATGGTMVGGQADKDGGTDAWIFTANNTSQSRFNQTISVSGVNTISMYAKAGTANFLCLYIIGSGDPRAFFNLSTGAVGSTGANIDANIQDVGNGWYRCSLTFDRTSSTLWCFVSNTDGDFNSAIGDSIYIQDAQLEQGLVATDYIETGTSAAQSGILEDMPRLDYSGGASCPALLLEPQRTNLVMQSEYLNSWTDAGTSTTLSSTTNPSGDAQSYIIASATSATNALRYDLTFSASTDYSYSLFLKAGTSEEVRMQIYDGNTFQRLAVNPLNNFAVVDQSGINSYSIEEYESGWYRVVMNFTTTASAGSGYLQIYPDRTGNLNNVEAWGAQVEAGSYPTSYIPTYGTSQTRSSESSSLTGFDSIPNGEGSVMIEFEIDEVSISGYPELLRIFNPSDATNFLFIYIFEQSAGDVKIGYRLDVNNVKKIEESASIALGTNKLVVRLQSGDYTAYLNGTEIAPSQTYNGVADVNMTSLRIIAQSFIANERIKQVLTFPTPLTDSECIALTTL